MRREEEHKGILAATVGHFFWGLSFLASRTALNTAPVTLLLSHRFLLAFLLMSLLIPTRLGDSHLRRKPISPLFFLGLLEPVIYFYGEQYGILHSNTIFSGVMISIIPIFCVLAAIPILHEKPTGGQMIFSLLSVGGVIGMGLLSRDSGALDWIGVAALLVAVASAVAYTLLNRNISARYTPFERTYGMLMTGAVVFTLMAAVSVKGDLAEYMMPFREPSYLISVLFLAGICSILCFFLSSYSLTKLTIARATVFANLTTVVSVFAGAVILHEPFSLTGLLCCAMILLGIYGVQRMAGKE